MLGLALQAAGCDAHSGRAAERFRAQRGGCGAAVRPGRSRRFCGVPTLLPVTLTLPLPLPLTLQALLDEGGLDGDAQEYFTRRSKCSKCSKRSKRGQGSKCSTVAAGTTAPQ